MSKKNIKEEIDAGKQKAVESSTNKEKNNWRTQTHHAYTELTERNELNVVKIVEIGIEARASMSAVDEVRVCCVYTTFSSRTLTRFRCQCSTNRIEAEVWPHATPFSSVWKLVFHPFFGSHTHTHSHTTRRIHTAYVLNSLSVSLSANSMLRLVF